MRGFVRRAAREVRGVREMQGQGCREVRGGAQEMQGQGCQSADGYNKGPGVERPRGQGLCI